MKYILSLSLLLTSMTLNAVEPHQNYFYLSTGAAAVPFTNAETTFNIGFGYRIHMDGYLGVDGVDIAIDYFDSASTSHTYEQTSLPRVLALFNIKRLNPLYLGVGASVLIASESKVTEHMFDSDPIRSSSESSNKALNLALAVGAVVSTTKESISFVQLTTNVPTYYLYQIKDFERFKECTTFGLTYNVGF